MKTNDHDFIEHFANPKEMPELLPHDKITITDKVPRVDKAIKVAVNAVWDAWLIGLEQSGYTVHRNPEPEHEPWEPEM